MTVAPTLQADILRVVGLVGARPSLVAVNSEEALALESTIVGVLIRNRSHIPVTPVQALRCVLFVLRGHVLAFATATATVVLVAVVVSAAAASTATAALVLGECVDGVGEGVDLAPKVAVAVAFVLRLLSCFE